MEKNYEKAPKMSNYSIEKKMLLRDVEEISISEEKVLVRGADQIIKEVDKSSFGGGETPNLQEVLDTGRLWISGTSAFTVDDPILGFAYQGNDEATAFIVRPDYMSIRVKDTDDSNSATLYMDKPTDGKVLDFILPTNKPTGTYTLATLDDISTPSMQQIYDKGRSINTDTGLIIINSSSSNQAYTAITGEVIEIYDNLSQGISISKDKILGFGFNRNNVIDFSKTTISQSTYKFPEKADGTYIFATTSDLAIHDPTVRPKSKTELNTEYPNALNGFRVQCPYISTGATIYEKTSIGWLQYPVDKVYDPE